MRLDRSTYEAWLLDRIEGVLTPAQERELDRFLAQHPELSTAIGGLPRIEGGDEQFPLKAGLHRDLPPKGAPTADRLNDFLAARVEGDLSAEQEKQLDRYLYDHPAVAQDASLMARTKVDGETIRFDDTTSIERHFPPRGLPDTHRLVDFLIAEVEGDLNAEQHTALELYLLEHSEAHLEQQLVAATFLEREGFAYPDKDALKKRAVRVVPLWPRLAAAASIALLLSAGWWLLRDSAPVEKAGIAQVEQAIPVASPKDQQGEGSASQLPVAIPMPEASHKESDEAVGKVTTNAVGVAQRMNSTIGVKASTGRDRHPKPTLPVLEPIQQITRAAIEHQALAQAPVGESEWTIAQAPVATPTTIAAVPSTGEGENVGTFLANKVRSDVLDAPKRASELDGNDALAMVDKAIGAVTAGQGGVDVHRSATRERIQLRLGRNFSISASRGR